MTKFWKMISSADPYEKNQKPSQTKKSVQPSRCRTKKITDGIGDRLQIKEWRKTIVETKKTHLPPCAKAFLIARPKMTFLLSHGNKPKNEIGQS